MAFRFGPKQYEQYEYVQIGTQKWMTRNLDVIRYRNGDPIPEVKDFTEWYNLTTGAWCYYNNDIKNGAIYGRLYNGYAVADNRGLAPVGWHIPSNTEWNTLASTLGGTSVAEKEMKEAGTMHWVEPNTGTNSSGFTALPGGARLDSNPASDLFISLDAILWSSTTDFGLGHLHCTLFATFDILQIYTTNGVNRLGCSVRCIKD